nr:AvrPit(Po) protein [Pyricularia oryzae]
MHTSTFLAATLAAASAVEAAQGSFRVPDIITPDWILHQARNNSLFTRWRPRSHFLAPAGWMNDPSGAFYDPATDLYHLQYQWHPNHANWGNVSWGHAVSKDLFHWKDIRDWRDDSSASLPSGRFENGPLSFFSGSTYPVNLNGKQDGTLLTFVTRLSDLPTSWLKPYKKNMEVQSMFRSKDAGQTWQELGPIIESPPKGWNVTGFRDPYVFPNPALDAIRGVGPHYYITLGSGIKGPNVPATFHGAARPGFLGPRMPLYAAPASDLRKWTFLGSLWESKPNASLGHPDITGAYGYNFETSGVFSLPIDKNAGNSLRNTAWFALMGTEGGNTTLHPHEHWAVWSRGHMAPTRGGGVKMTPTSSGAADWGITYAHTSFEDARRGNGNRRVMWGWANEDVSEVPRPGGPWMYHVLKAFGYAGAMNLPIELFVKTTHGLQRHTYVDGNEWIPDTRSGYTAQTLGMRPLPDVMKLLTAGATQETFDVGTLQAGHAPKKISNHVGDSWVMTVTLGATQGPAGIIIAQSPNNAEYTKIIYDPHAKKIVVRREHSTLLKGVFNTHTLTGHFAPYKYAHGAVEDIKFTIVFDKSLLEIFVNDRFALTTRLYPVRRDSTGISFFAGEAGANGRGGRASAAPWKQAVIWKGLNKAWPGRPEDSSSRLIWDPPSVTNGGLYWEGW